MNDKIMIFLAGVLVGQCIVIGITQMPGSIVREANRAIDECKQNLPHNQICKIIGVPK